MKKLLFLMAAALALGCQQPPNTGPDDQVVQPDPDPIPRVAGIQFAKSYDLARAGQFVEEFTLMGQRDIIAAIDFQASDLPSEGGVHLIQFRVLNPASVEQSIYWVAYSADSSPPISVTHPNGMSTLQVQRATLREGWMRVYGEIPVAGTIFTQYRLTGQFSAEARIGQDESATVLASPFEMTKY